MKRTVMILFIVTLALVSCSNSSSQPTSAVTDEFLLTPYQTTTGTPTITAIPPDVPTATLAPTVTPTPWVYTVKANDTLIVIAYRNGITLDELQAANPEVNAYNLSIGMRLNIPAPQQKQGTQNLPNPTPAPLLIKTPNCIVSLTGGFSCFVVVENSLQVDLENLVGEFRLTDPQTGDVISQSAQLPLRRLQAGKSLPFYAYFAPPVFENPQVGFQMITTTAVTAGSGNYLPLVISDHQVVIDFDGRSAEVTGTLRLDGESWSVSKIMLAAIAYDIAGNVIGVRRLEKNQEISSGESQPFALSIYSVGGRIHQVEIYGEGLP